MSTCKPTPPKIINLTFKSLVPDSPEWDDAIPDDLLEEYDPDFDINDLNHPKLNQSNAQSFLPPNNNKPNLSRELGIKSFLPPHEELKAVETLTAIQSQAVKYVAITSRILSQKVELKVNSRVLKMRGDFEQLLLYIRDRAPIIIHLNLSAAARYLDTDTHYRNCFETRGHNSGRVSWEDRMFGNIYHDATPFERVKYGVLNVLNDPYGVQACYGYGNSYLRLKKVRLRTSFAPQDTAGACPIASCENYCHVLDKYNDKELQAAVDVAMNRKQHCNSNIISSYKEIQIHGPVNLSEHVEELVVNPQYRNKGSMIGLLKRIGKKHGFRVIWMDDRSPIYTPPIKITKK
jgi:hypothetical protein